MVWSFKKPIEALIGRIKRVGGFGGEAEFTPLPTGQQDQLAADSAPTALPAPDARVAEKPPENTIYDPLDAALAEQLNQFVGGGWERKLAWAIRARSVAETERMHEAQYRNMFGSQINALRVLQSMGGVALAGTFRPIYERAATNPEWAAIYQGRTFEVWGQYLFEAGYVEEVEGTDPLQVRITSLGIDFLQWMLLRRASEMKPF